MPGQVSGNLTNVLERGNLGSPDEVRDMFIEAFTLIIFDPDMVNSGKSVVSTSHPLSAFKVVASLFSPTS